MRLIWLLCGLLSLGIGIVGIFLPLIPTVPLVLLAAFCFARSSQRLHEWLVTHKHFGPLIDDWQQNGAIRPRAKRMATVSIAMVFIISIVLGVPTYVLGIQIITLSAVLLFIWTRPS